MNLWAQLRQRSGHLIASSLCVCGPLWAADWPRIAMPPDVHAFAVGEQFTANGLPMRVQGFVAKEHSASELAAWFRHSLGEPLVENRQGGKWILGRAEGGYYLTVQIEALAPDARLGSKGLLAVSDLATLNRNRDADAASAQRWLERWPAGTQLVSRMTSEDGGRAALHVALRNGHSPSLNRDALIAHMQEDGLALVQESGAPDGAKAHVPWALQDARSFYFKGPGKEGMATIARDAQGLTAVVLNTTTALGAYGR